MNVYTHVRQCLESTVLQTLYVNFMGKFFLRLEVKWKNEESGWLLAHLEFPKASQI